MKTNLVLIAAFTFGLGINNASAQVKKHEENQKDRIQQGVKSGELTHKEAKDLREDHKELREDVKLAKADGKITRPERKIIRNEGRQDSREIYRLKHNGRTRK